MRSGDILAILRGRPLDWERIDMQEGRIEIPVNHPSREYIEVEKRALAGLSPRELDERAFIIGQKNRVGDYCKGEWAAANTKDRMLFIEKVRLETKKYLGG